MWCGGSLNSPDLYLIIFLQRRSGRNSRRDLQLHAVDERPRRPSTGARHRGDGSSHQDVQVLNLDDKSGHTFYRDGNAEILQLDGGDNSSSLDGATQTSENRDLSPVRIEFQDFDDDNDLSLLHNAGQNGGRVSDISYSEDKNVQTDLSYGRTSKKSQTLHLAMSDTEEDLSDIASQSLSNSQSSSYRNQHGFGLKSFNDPGFLNLAMHTLVRDELKNGRRSHLRSQQLGELEQLQQLEQQQRLHLLQQQQLLQPSDYEDSEFEKSHRSLLSYPGRTHFSRHSHRSHVRHQQGLHQTQRTEASSQPGRSNKNFSVNSRKTSKYTYYNGTNSPPPQTYSETKASILRKRTMNARPSGLNNNKQQSRKKSRNQQLIKRNAVSMSDLSGLIPEESKDSSSKSENGSRRRRRVSSPSQRTNRN